MSQPKDNQLELAVAEFRECTAQREDDVAQLAEASFRAGWISARARPEEIDDSHRLARARAALEVANQHLTLAALQPPLDAVQVARAYHAVQRGLAQIGERKRGTLEEAERVMASVAREVENRLPAGWCFLVLACSRTAPGFTSYVANVERADAVALLTEWLVKIQLRKPGV